MFDFVQKNKRILQVFLGLIAITFATWGIESYTRFAGSGDTVASVNGSDITQREFSEQLRVQFDGDEHCLSETSARAPGLPALRNSIICGAAFGPAARSI